MSNLENKPFISVIVITKNEELDLPGCLDSVKHIANEIVLIDSGSTDRTLDIAKKYTSEVFHHEWKGYGPQKQFALEKAKGPWILNLDADERVSTELAKEISEILSGEVSENGFDVPFRHYFLGKRLRFGGVHGETHLRLFRKNGASYGNNPIHEGIAVPSPIGQTRGWIDHTSYRDLEEYKQKREEYTTLIAQKKYANGERFHIWHHFRLPFEFLMRYIFKLGFLDGVAGLTYARLSSVYVWMKFLKLREIEKSQKGVKT